MGVRTARLLLLANGRGLGVFWFWRGCAEDSAGFLMVNVGREMDDCLIGVAAGVMTLALALRFPGAVMDSLLEGTPNLFGVAGRGCCAPSLVDGLLPFDMAEAGRSGGGMLLSPLKKLDLRLPFFGAGDDGSCDRLSIVLSESEGLLFFFCVCSGWPGWSSSSEMALSGSGSLSRKPALELAREDALEADLKPSSLPNVSSCPPGVDDEVGRDASLDWREGGRANCRLKAGASLVLEAAVETRRWPKLGIPLVRREEARGVRPELGFEGAAVGVAFKVAAVGGPLGYTSDALDVFFCRVEFVGREMDDKDGFLRSCSEDAGARSWDWLPDGLSTGRRDAGAGLGMPEGRGIEDDGSMVSRAIRCNA